MKTNIVATYLKCLGEALLMVQVLIMEKKK